MQNYSRNIKDLKQLYISTNFCSWKITYTFDSTKQKKETIFLGQCIGRPVYYPPAWHELTCSNKLWENTISCCLSIRNKVDWTRKLRWVMLCSRQNNNILCMVVGSMVLALSENIVCHFTMPLYNLRVKTRFLKKKDYKRTDGRTNSVTLSLLGNNASSVIVPQYD